MKSTDFMALTVAVIAFVSMMQASPGPDLREATTVAPSQQADRLAHAPQGDAAQGIIR